MPAELLQRIDWWLDLQQPAHAIDVGDEARDFDRSRRHELDVALSTAQPGDALGQLQDRRARAAADVDRWACRVGTRGAHQRLDDLIDPHEVDQLLAAVDDQVLATRGSLQPQRNDAAGVARAVDIGQTQDDACAGRSTCGTRGTAPRR